MKRSLRKAVALLTFLAMTLELAFAADVTPVKAAGNETTFEVSDWDCVIGINNPTASVTIPGDLDATSVSVSLYETGIKSLKIEGGYTSVSVYDGGEDLEELILPKNVDSIYISSCPKLKSVDLGKSASNISIYSCDKLESITAPASASYFDISFCAGVKSITLSKGLQSYSQWECPNAKVTIPSTVSWLSSDDYSNITISSDNPYYEKYDDSLYRDNMLVKAANKKELKIKPGAVGVAGSALCNCFAVTTIDIPESVELLDYGAFAGATGVKKLKLPKGLVCIYSYAFEGLGADSIEIPTGVSYVSEDAFGGYKGTINFENGYCYALYSRNGAIYSADGGTLYYYPKNKTTLSLEKSCVTLAYSSLNGCKFKEIDLPEGASCLYLDLLDCKNLKTINIPSSVCWVDSWCLAYRTPNSLEKYTVADDNPYFSSQGGCLYSKDKEYLYSVPPKKKEVKVVRGCVTIGYYAFGDYYKYNPATDEYEYKELTVELPGTIGYIQDMYPISYAKVSCGTTAAALISDYNSWSWRPISYEFTESSKEILNKIAVSDDVQIKKSTKGASVSYTYPPGLNIVTGFTALHEGTNVYAKVSFTSNKKSVVKVNKKTGAITPVKKGKATITAKFELPDGTSKKFKVKVTVK